MQAPKEDELDDESARLLLRSVKGYAIYLLDPGGHVISWHPGAHNLKEYTAAEVLGKHYSMFFAPEDRAKGQPDRELAAAAAGVYEGEGWRIRKGGARFWASVTVTPLFNADESLRGFAKVTRDMTESRLAQEERLRLEQAETALRLRDQFLNEARRELNAVLTTIRVHIESLKGTVTTFGDDNGRGVNAKLKTLEWGLDRLSDSIEQVLRAAMETGERLLQDLRRGSSRG